MNQTIRIVLLDDSSENDAFEITQTLHQAGYSPKIVRVETLTAMEQALTQPCDLSIITVADARLSSSLFAALAYSKTKAIPCIVVLEANIGAEQVVDTLQAGAHDVIMKGNINRLITTISHELYKVREYHYHHHLEQELRKGESRYRIISDLFSDYAYAFRIEPDGTFVREWVTDAFVRVTGYTPEELDNLGGWQHLIYPEDMPIAIKRQHKLLSGLPDSSEFRIVTKDGRIRWLREQGNSLPGTHDGRAVLFLYSVAQDITEQKQAEAELQHSEDRFHTIFRVSPLPIIVTYLSNNTIIDANQSFLQLVDRSREEVIGRTPNDLGFLPIENDQMGHEPLVDHIRQHFSLNEINVVFAPQAKPKRLLMAWMERIELQNETCILTMLHDYTEKQQGEDALRQERDFTNTILDTVDALVTVFTPQGYVVRFNRACERISGYTQQVMIQRDFLQTLIPPNEHQQLTTNFQNLLAGNKPISYEGNWISKEGNLHHIAWSSTVLANAQGTIEYIICTGLDITEWRKSEERIHQQIQRLAALRRIQMNISSSLDQYLALTMLLDHVLSLLEIDAGVVLLMIPHTQILEYIVGKGFHSAGIQWTRLRIGEGSAGRVALERRPVSIPDVMGESAACTRKHLLKKEGFTSYYGLPLIAKGQVKGVLELFHRSPIVIDQESQNFLEALAGHTAVVIDNAELVAHLQRSKDELTNAYNETIEGWARAMELRDAETEGHSRRVTNMTIRLAEEMGVQKEDLVHIYRGAILHDIGKMGIPDSILLKNGPLTDDEWEIMCQHPLYAYQLLKPIGFLEPALKIPYYHHERWDGSGYPAGLKGTDIPLEARIFAIVDVWDALSTDRPYRKAWSQDRVFDYLLAHAGSHFDPYVVEVFCKVMGREYVREKSTP